MINGQAAGRSSVREMNERAPTGFEVEVMTRLLDKTGSLAEGGN